MTAISGFAEQCRKMNAVCVGGPLGRAVYGEKQLIGNIALMYFLFFHKSGNEEAERTSDSTVVHYKFLFGIR